MNRVCYRWVVGLSVLVVGAGFGAACGGPPAPSSEPQSPASSPLPSGPSVSAVVPVAATSASLQGVAVASPQAAGTTPGRSGSIPNWTATGNDPKRGSVTLRCENAFPPDDHSGMCMCEGYDLRICVEGPRQLVVDRKQCNFTCKPRPTNAKQIALRCPDGSNVTASEAGCECSGRRPMDPCMGGLASATVRAGECVVTCTMEQ